ncbi:MAG: spore cortex biosynthesis protein YabQ [Clostridia bacterium]|nr:spore cortex biosynthesis protein YabQ [Clostridia bacterium]
MKADANVYSLLLLASFIAGIALCAFKDLLRLFRALLFRKEALDGNNIPIFHKPSQSKQPSSATQSATECHSGFSQRSAVFQLYPHTFSRSYTVFTAITDVIFAIISSVFAVLLTYQFNRGELRGFVLIALAAGFFSYNLTLSKPIYRLILRITDTLLSVLLKLIAAILSPTARLLSRYLRALKRIQRTLGLKKRRKKYAARLISQASRGFESWGLSHLDAEDVISPSSAYNCTTEGEIAAKKSH